MSESEDGAGSPPEFDESSTFEPVSTRKALKTVAADLWHRQPGSRPITPSPATSAKKIVNGLDRREITIGIVLLLLNLYLVITWSHHLNISPSKSLRADAPTFLDTGLIATFVVMLGVIIRRRALLGFACFLAAFVFLHYDLGVQFIFNLAFGGWLLIRAQRLQRQLRGPIDKPVRAQGARKPSPTPTPTPSKRYTPPKRSRPSGRR